MELKKVFFWNVDTQRDFMEETGALYVPGAREIRPALARLTAFAREKGIPVVSSADYHYQESAELSDAPDFKTTYPPHCMAETPGAELIPETCPQKPLLISWEKLYRDFDTARRREFLVTKDAFDVFEGNPNMDDFVEALYDETGRDTAVVYGVSGNVCVKYAVDGLRERDFRVVVISDAIASLPQRERMVIVLRYYRSFTQERTARVIGVSQVQVSRIERKAVQHLREKLL